MSSLPYTLVSQNPSPGRVSSLVLAPECLRLAAHPAVAPGRPQPFCPANTWPGYFTLSRGKAATEELQPRIAQITRIPFLLSVKSAKSVVKTRRTSRAVASESHAIAIFHPPFSGAALPLRGPRVSAVFFTRRLQLRLRCAVSPVISQLQFPSFNFQCAPCGPRARPARPTTEQWQKT